MISGCRKHLVWILCLFPYLCLSQQAEFVQGDNGITEVRFRGITAEQNLEIYLPHGSYPVAGEWHTQNDEVVFRPIYALPWEASFSLRSGAGQVFKFKTPGWIGDTAPHVLAIFPLNDSVPVNLLKVQIVFDQPMLAGKSSEYLRWYDSDSGEIIPDVFLELSPELWSSGYDTLTMWLDPGRIKRDLIPNRQMGNPLELAKTYRLEVLRGWPSATGQPIAEGLNKAYTTIPADRISPDPGKWKIKLPAPGTREPLIIIPDEPLDLMTTLDAIEVLDSANTFFEIETDIDYNPYQILLNPVKTWKKGNYNICIKSLLEDLAGNRVDRLFDEDLHSQDQDLKINDVISINIE